MEAYALKKGTAAPLVGTLMEIIKVLRCPDGRLIVLATGLGRIKVLVVGIHPFRHVQGFGSWLRYHHFDLIQRETPHQFMDSYSSCISCLLDTQ